MSLEPKHWSWWFLRYWQFDKWYHSGYLLICLISWPLLISSKHDWYQLKGLFKGFWIPLRQWESLKNWWRYGQMKFVTNLLQDIDGNQRELMTKFIFLSFHHYSSSISSIPNDILWTSSLFLLFTLNSFFSCLIIFQNERHMQKHLKHIYS